MGDFVHDWFSRLCRLGNRVEELFVQQSDRIGFHNDSEDNHYVKEEYRLSSLLVAEGIPDAKRSEYALALIALTDRYRASFINSLNNIGIEIAELLAAFEQKLTEFEGFPPERLAEIKERLDAMETWLTLSKELHSIRLNGAARSVAMRVDCDYSGPRNSDQAIS